jgi:anionic cell wall polymer biosynthesis LytR-Cps2A-Psr (LCP) family protein
MSTEQEDKQAEVTLTPEQRLDALEGKVGKNRIVLMSIALILIVTLSASITAFMMHYFGGVSANSGSSNNTETIQTLEGQAELLEQYDIRLAELSSQLKTLDNKIENSSNATIQRILVEQEQAKQKFMDTVRSSIYDLAHMVPGSRSWLELYSEQLDEAMVKSQQREKALKELQTSEPVANKDPFFGDEF